MNDSSLVDQMLEGALGISATVEQQEVQQQAVESSSQHDVLIQGNVISDDQKQDVKQDVGEVVKQEDGEGDVEGVKAVKDDVNFLDKHFSKKEEVDVKSLEESYKKLKGDYDKLRSNMLGFEEGINPDYYRLHLVEKDNPKLASIYKRLLLDNLSSKEYLMMSMVMDDPDLVDDTEMLNMLLEEKYPSVFDEFADVESADYKKSVKLFNYDAKKAEQRLRHEFSKIEVPKFGGEDKSDRSEKVLETWRDFNFSDKSLTTVNVSLSGDKDGELVSFMDIEIPDQDRERYLKAALAYMVDRGVENVKGSGDMMKKLVSGMWIGENLNKYNRLIIEQRMRMSDREWRKFIHHPKEHKTDAGVVEKDLIESMFDEMM